MGTRTRTRNGAFLRRVYASFTGAEIRDLSEGRGALLERLPESRPAKLFLPNPEAVGRIAREHCRTLSREPAQIDLVTRTAPKRGLCIAQRGENGRA